MRERGKNEKKMENKTTGKVGEKRRERKPLEFFLLQWDKRLQHDGGRCQVMCDKSKLMMT